MSQPNNPHDPQWTQPGQAPGGVPDYGGYPGRGGYAAQPEPSQQPGPYAQPNAGQQPYPPHAGYPQGQYPPAYYARGHYPPAQQASGAGALKIVGVVFGALVLLAVVGGALAAFGTRTAAPTIPEPPPPATTSPSRTEPSTAGQGAGQPESGGGPIAVDDDISVRPAPGWTMDRKDSDSVTLTDGEAIFLAQATSTSGVSAEMLMRTYLDQLGSAGTDVRTGQISDVARAGRLDAVTSSMTMTMAGPDGSQNVGVLALVSVRSEDGSTAIGTLIYPSSSDSDEVAQAFNSMTTSMTDSQLS